MRKVIYVGEEPEGEKGAEFTHYLNEKEGWCETFRNDHLGEEKYIGCIKSGSVFKIVDFYGNDCGVCCDCYGMCKKIMEGA